MRHFITYLLSTIALITLLGSCERATGISYMIEVHDMTCTSEAQDDIKITYLLHTNVLETDVRANIHTNAEWITIGDTSTLGEFSVSITENTGMTRSAEISIAVDGCQTTKMTLTQLGVPPAESNHTLMYLFMGTSLSRYFTTNIEDASKAIATGILGNNNRVLFFRQESASKGYIGELCFATNNQCEVRRLQDITIDSGLITPEVVGGYIATMAEYAPAKRYGLICAGHGQAWLPRDVIISDKDISKLSFDYDPWEQAAGAETTRAFGDKPNFIMNIPELASAIELSGVELDYLLFDACFMSNIETVYELRNLANYIIASPCEIMGRGFPYEKTLPHLFVDGGNTTNYVGAAESYHLYYRDEYANNARSASIAVFDCSEIEALADATKRIMKSATEEYDASKLQTYEGQKVHHFYDFGQWANTVATDSEALNSFNNQLSKCVIAKYTIDTFYSAYGVYGVYNIDTNVYSGVTTSAPSKAYPNAWKQTSWYNYICSD